jgi:nucleoid-associated protein YgaU
MSLREVMLLGELGALGADVFQSDVVIPPPPISTGLAIPDVKRSAPLANGGWPPAAKPVKAAWNKDGTYRLQSGDTLSGLSKTYLGEYGRWKEIWHVQTPDFLSKHPTADRVRAGEVLQMPAEAKATARKMGFLRGTTVWWVLGGTGAAGVAAAAIHFAGR